ncbi:Endonuclease III-like protein 1 [Phytophthora boehmeriae]|uniref:Endonuclease III homolog n=1 Tax=Phytophthora boehmeriae TaxID=109152 RepID=A0A8T1XBF8_9STRA|nr:Endonuclease III-like protein 1 [Phytophthora boehmeriae]
MGTKETSSAGNPFTRFAFASSHSGDSGSHADVKVEVATHKRQRNEVEATSLSRPKKKQERLVKTELDSKTDASDNRLELLLRLFEARESMETPIDNFGTQVCVAPGVTSAKVERFQLLVAALLSSQTQDPITYGAMQRLHDLGEGGEGLTIETVLNTSEDRLDEVLTPVGFHHRKAQQLKRVASILRTQHHSDIPHSLDDLMALPGIGPKIGRVIMLLAWGKVDGIVVDTHVHRLAQRLGWASTSTPEDTRRELEDWIPREHWSKLSLAVVGFGQVVCTARHPSCSKCPLADKCPSAFKVEASTSKKKKQQQQQKSKTPVHLNQ